MTFLCSPPWHNQQFGQNRTSLLLKDSIDFENKWKKMSQFVIRKVPNVVKQDFWTSTKGREYVGYGVGALGVTVVCATSLSQTVFVENCINVFRSYKWVKLPLSKPQPNCRRLTIHLIFVIRLGIARKVPENIQRHINTATELVQINPFRRNFIRSFVVTGVDVCDVGEYFHWIKVYGAITNDINRLSDCRLAEIQIRWLGWCSAQLYVQEHRPG